MRAIIAVVFLVISACDNGDTWSVRVGEWEAPICTGVASLSEPSGTWMCGRYGGSAHADFRDDGRVFLDLETAPGFLNGVRARMEGDDVISGDILLDNEIVPFVAHR